MLKKILLITLGLFLFILNCFSQKKIKSQQGINLSKEITRCATDERVKMLFKAFPEMKLRAERLSQAIPDNSLRTFKRLQSVVYLPVVFHIVLPNPYSITDADVQSQIDAMNTDFSGLNPDTTHLPAAFEAVRGHSFIRFVLAKRTPSGQLTNGTDRVISATTANPDNVIDSIKRSSFGGADAWDPTSYVNIWVGSGSGEASGVLGYTQIPGSGSPQDDGVFCNILGFSIRPCNIADYNQGRTVVHELGHYFGLNHIWGDDETAANTCSGDDFRALTTEGSTYMLPPSLYNPPGQGNTANDIGDTPNQSVATYNCPSGTVSDSCTVNPSGKMYEDYMDYTADDCYDMFTKKQVARMEYVLNTYRTLLLTSSGATLPTNPIMTDAGPIKSVNPGGYEYSGCNSIYYPSVINCSGNFAPKVMIKNNGVNTITSITVGYVLNNTSPVAITLNTNLVSGGVQIITFPLINVLNGNNTFKFFTTNVNGTGTDQVPANDTLTATLSVPNPIALPVSEGFEGSTFPPTGWSINNPDNKITWQKVTPGSKSAHSIYIDNYDDNPGQVDEIKTPKINLATTDPVVISFDLAHKNYPNPNYNDSLQVLVSTDCGSTYTAYFNKAGTALATAGSSDSAYINPAPGDWKNQKIIIDGSKLSSGNIIVMFRNTSDYGNNIFIDNIDIQQQTSRDITVLSVTPPTPTECVESIVPVASVKNVGYSTITGFNISYGIDNGALAETTVTGISLLANDTITIPLTTFTPTEGQHTITVFSADPVSSSGTGDESPLNDTLSKAFFVTGKVTLPVALGFEDPTFPPAKWSVENPDGGITWQRTTVAAKTGTASMVINNYNETSTGTTDKFVSPVITETSSFDSLFISFDYAYNAGNSSSLSDTLELQATTDCGNTFTTIWQNYGTGLQTKTGYSPGFIPSANDWQNVRLNLFNYVGKNDFQVYFVFNGNKQNNLYLDNINLYGITVPARLKSQGYLIYPNPFHQQFIIRNYEVPVTLQSAHIYNSIGQLMWSKEYNGQAYTLMNVDFGNEPPGVYILKLQYTDKTVVQKIVKQ